MKLNRIVQKISRAIIEELTEQDVLDHCQITVNGDGDYYEAVIVPDIDYLDEVDEIAIYTALAEDMTLADIEVNIVVTTDPDSLDALETDMEEEEEEDNDPEKDNEAAEIDEELTVIDPEKDEKDTSEEDEEAEEDGLEDMALDEPMPEDYTATWEDLEAFDKEHGEEYGWRE